MRNEILNTHTSSTNAINCAIRKAGIANIELRGGRGYQYFVYSEGDRYDTRSEYVCYVRDLTIAQWVERAREARREMDGTAELERTAANLRRYFKANRK